MYEFPKLYTLCHERVINFANAGIAAAEQRLTYLVEKQRTQLDVLHHATMRYLLTGIADCKGPMPDLGYDVLYPSRFNWHSYFWKLSKELKRPYVVIDRWHGVAYLHVQKQKYTEILVGRWMILPNYRISGNTREWLITIAGEEVEALERWIDDCRTDPELRKALRLP